MRRTYYCAFFTDLRGKNAVRRKGAVAFRYFKAPRLGVKGYNVIFFRVFREDESYRAFTFRKYYILFETRIYAVIFGLGIFERKNLVTVIINLKTLRFFVFRQYDQEQKQGENRNYYNAINTNVAFSEKFQLLRKVIVLQFYTISYACAAAASGLSAIFLIRGARIVGELIYPAFRKYRYMFFSNSSLLVKPHRLHNAVCAAGDTHLKLYLRFYVYGAKGCNKIFSRFCPILIYIYSNSLQ